MATKNPCNCHRPKMHDSKVVDVREPRDPITVRRRQCKTCKGIFYSIEVIILDKSFLEYMKEYRKMEQERREIYKKI